LNFKEAKMRKTAGLFLICVVLLWGCGAGIPEDEVLISVVEKNIQMSRDENIEGFLDTVHEEAPGYSTMKQGLEQMFNAYDFSYELKEADVLDKSRDEARIHFIQVTKKISGPEFQDNVVEGIHTLKRSKGIWKILNTEVTNVSFLKDTKE
jgi:hypothetical protein